MDKFEVDDVFCNIEGYVTLRAYRGGTLAPLIRKGLSLEEIEKIARPQLRDLRQVKNLTVTTGKRFIAARIAGTETVGLSYFAFGTGTTTPAISNSQLATETLRKALTECFQSDNYVLSSVFLLASECTFYIKEGGLFGGSYASLTADSGSMLCRFLLDYDNSVTAYDLTVQHTGEVK